MNAFDSETLHPSTMNVLDSEPLHTSTVNWESLYPSVGLLSFDMPIAEPVNTDFAGAGVFAFHDEETLAWDDEATDSDETTDSVHDEADDVARAA